MNQSPKNRVLTIVIFLVLLAGAVYAGYSLKDSAPADKKDTTAEVSAGEFQNIIPELTWHTTTRVAVENIEDDSLTFRMEDTRFNDRGVYTLPLAPEETLTVEKVIDMRGEPVETERVTLDQLEQGDLADIVIVFRESSPRIVRIAIVSVDI